MTLRSSLAATAMLAIAATAAAPVAAFDMGAMTDAERQAFRDEIRAYLMENPEVLLEAIDVLEQRQADAQAENDVSLVQTNAAEIFDDGYSWVGGNPDGDITMVEFMDYRCGYCRRAHPDVNALLENDGNIRYIVKEFPILGDQSVLAAQFAISVKAISGDAAYAKVHDALMTMRADVSPETLQAMAEDHGLPTDEIMAMMDSDEVQEIIRQNRELAQRLGINGTPSFIFETEMVRGYVPLDGMLQLVDEIRSEG